MRKYLIGLILTILLAGLAITSCTPQVQAPPPEPTHWTYEETDAALTSVTNQAVDFVEDMLKRAQTLEQGMDIRIVNCVTVMELTNTLPSLMKVIEQNAHPDTKQIVSCYKEWISMFLDTLLFAEGLCENYTPQNELLFVEKGREIALLMDEQGELCESYVTEFQERWKKAEERSKKR